MKKRKECLKQIFEKQLEFQRKVHGPFSKIDTKNIKEKEKLSDQFLLCLIDEVIEFRGTYNKKSWIKKRFKINRDELNEELADIYIFLIDLSLLWDLKPEKVIEVIKQKQIKNFKRLKNKK